MKTTASRTVFVCIRIAPAALMLILMLMVVPPAAGQEEAFANDGRSPRSIARATPIPPAAEKPASAIAPATLNPFLQPLGEPGVPSSGNSAIQTTDSGYVLSPNDEIEMTVFREPDLTTKATISRDGTVQFPLINDVKLAGLTIKQARNEIRNRYNADYLVEPQVALSVTKFSERRFTVIGQVKSPGTYNLTGDEQIHLMEAIGMAGGFTRIADRRNVIVKRTNGGSSESFRINAKKMTESSSEAAFRIMAGDVISVGESWY